MLVILQNQAIHRMMAPRRQLRIRSPLEGAFIGDLDRCPSGTNDVRSASTKILFTSISLSGTKVVGHAQLRGGERFAQPRSAKWKSPGIAVFPCCPPLRQVYP
jgi:hypothetical protein